jgi:hypothetical protein
MDLLVNSVNMQIADMMEPAAAMVIVSIVPACVGMVGLDGIAPI